MMKKRGVYIFFILLFLGLTFVAADTSSNLTGIDKAYQCLSNKINNSCSSLTDEEKAFSLLAIGQCQSDLLSDAKTIGSGKCWPSSGCSIKTTAQALLALNSSGGDSSSAQNWLYSQNATPTQIVWYLEIDSSNSTSCTIEYNSGQSYTVNIDENKQLSSGAGNCLALSQNGYLLQVSPSCYNKNFQISCTNDFLTTTLFRKSTSSTVYVTDTTNSAASGGTTTENVKSSCFSTGTTCDYEGTLWAALALNAAGQDISNYLPYLIVMADENQKFLPDAFLYALTAKLQYKTSLLLLQQSSEYWMESGDKYYDTALALYPLQNENSSEKTNAQTWLLGSQDSAGCWNSGNIRDTAFILASSWPRQFSSGGGPTGPPDCITAGHSCTLLAQCSQENILTNYQCSSLSVCCNTPPSQQTCAEQGGEICSSNQICGLGNTNLPSSDTNSSQLCCSNYGCITQTATSTDDCTSNNGTCRAGGCATGEQATNSYTCTLPGDTCCVISTAPSSSSSGGSSLWIWILVILIVLVGLGIIFRKKLRAIIFKEGKTSSKPGMQPPRGPPYYPRPIQRMPERRIIIPPQRPSQPIRRVPSKSQNELDEVLKKLKEMGK